MKLPQDPPNLSALFQRIIAEKRLSTVLKVADTLQDDSKYLHWDALRRRTPPEGLTHEEWWMALKWKRKATYRSIPLLDKHGNPFVYSAPDTIQEILHQIDSGSRGVIGMPSPLTNPQTRDRYLVSSLIEEAITSSQLEGAVATREAAKDIIKAGRKPRDRSEQMILNNFRTMKHIKQVVEQPLTPKLVLELHQKVTENAIDKEGAAGRLRTEEEAIKVTDAAGTIYHDPPPAAELADRMQRMCDFANGKTPDHFVHPVLRAIMLHFWLAYDHPFYDGNGRTARALFYWLMLKSGYWLFEFVSISTILVKAPTKYAQSFLHTESDENDLNYFLIAQAGIIQRAIEELHAYIERKTRETAKAGQQIKALRQLNHRQQSLVMDALEHPGKEYSIAGHQISHGVAYGTARSDLLDLVGLNLLSQSKRGKAMMFSAESNIRERLQTWSEQTEL